jgi:lysophospholipase L1-like esterase
VSPVRRRTRRALIGVAAVPVVAIAVLAAEVQMARRGPDLPDRPELGHDGRIGGPGAALRMVWIGDSTAAGVGASSASTAIPQRVASALDRPVDLTVLAVSGARIADVLQDQLPQVAALDPHIVLVSVGANDVVHLTSREDFRSRFHELLDRLPEPATVLLLGVPDMGAPPRFAEPLRSLSALRGRQLEAITADVADERRATYVDIAHETGPEMRSDTDRYFAGDDYHPSDDGYRLWADAVLERLVPLLETSAPIEAAPGASDLEEVVSSADR